MYSVSQKITHTTFCNISTRVKNIYVKFSPFVASLYSHNFGRFILIFDKMALIFRCTYRFLPFQVSASQTAVTSSPMMSGSTGLSGFGAMLESYNKLQLKLKSVPEF